jgi:hypothetical protein
MMMKQERLVSKRLVSERLLTVLSSVQFYLL